MGYKGNKVDSTGSFVVVDGTANYIGSKSNDPNRVMTFDGDNINSTNLGNLFDQYIDDTSIGIVKEAPPPTVRPADRGGGDVREGDLWYNLSDGQTYIFTGDKSSYPTDYARWSPTQTGVTTSIRVASNYTGIGTFQYRTFDIKNGVIRNIIDP